MQIKHTFYALLDCIYTFVYGKLEAFWEHLAQNASLWKSIKDFSNEWTPMIMMHDLLIGQKLIVIDTGGILPMFRGTWWMITT